MEWFGVAENYQHLLTAMAVLFLYRALWGCYKKEFSSNYSWSAFFSKSELSAPIAIGRIALIFFKPVVTAIINVKASNSVHSGRNDCNKYASINTTA